MASAPAHCVYNTLVCVKMLCMHDFSPLCIMTTGLSLRLVFGVVGFGILRTYNMCSASV